MTSFDLRSSSISRRGLRDDVYDRILAMLMRGDAAPGTRLSIDTIARQLEVSPTPVREALVQLERTGLVTRIALKGYRVAPPLGKKQLSELVQAREMLEVTAARLASEHAPELLPELRDAHEQHCVAGEAVIAALDAGTKDVTLSSEYYALDHAFHDVIFRHSGNRYIMDMSNNLGAQLHRLRQAVHRGVTDVREAISEHQSIIEAFETQDPLEAEAAMRRHLQNILVRSLLDEE